MPTDAHPRRAARSSSLLVAARKVGQPRGRSSLGPGTAGIRSGGLRRGRTSRPSPLLLSTGRCGLRHLPCPCCYISRPANPIFRAVPLCHVSRGERSSFCRRPCGRSACGSARCCAMPARAAVGEGLMIDRGRGLTSGVLETETVMSVDLRAIAGEGVIKVGDEPPRRITPKLEPEGE
jgi:hypothetical protein